MDTIGDRIRFYRKQANNGNGITQKELGEACGMYESQIRKYELGKANPKIETIQKIADALGVSVYDLLNKKDAETLKQITSPEFVQEFASTVTSGAIKMMKEALQENYDRLNGTGKQLLHDYSELLLSFPQLLEKDK